MLTITPEAREYILSQNRPYYIDVPPEIGCCFHVVETPTVRAGEPREADKFNKIAVGSQYIFVPKNFPDHPLSLSVTSFLGRKKLVIEGWHLA